MDFVMLVDMRAIVMVVMWGGDVDGVVDDGDDYACDVDLGDGDRVDENNLFDISFST